MKKINKFKCKFYYVIIFLLSKVLTLLNELMLIFFGL